MNYFRVENHKNHIPPKYKMVIYYDNIKIGKLEIDRSNLNMFELPFSFSSFDEDWKNLGESIKKLYNL
jgi:hypothetical protein